MSVSQEQVNAMKNLMLLFDDAVEGKKVTPSPKNDMGMRNILEAFRSATDDAINQGQGNRDFDIALETEQTDYGVRVGSWEISVREDVGKYYDICHTITKEPIASNLRLYDSAHGIIQALNEGDTFTSARIKSIIDLDATYSRALSDAVTFSARMKVTEGMKHDVAEARYGEARRQALTAKKSIQKLLK